MEKTSCNGKPFNSVLKLSIETENNFSRVIFHIKFCLRWRRKGGQETERLIFVPGQNI